MTDTNAFWQTYGWDTSATPAWHTAAPVRQVIPLSGETSRGTEWEANVRTYLTADSIEAAFGINDEEEKPNY